MTTTLKRNGVSKMLEVLEEIRDAIVSKRRFVTMESAPRRQTHGGKSKRQASASKRRKRG